MTASKSGLMLPVLIGLGIFVAIFGLLLLAGSFESEQGGTGAGGWSDLALSDIPAPTRAIYEQAAAQYQLGADGPQWLAGFLKVETNHGRSTLPGVTSGVNDYGCCAGAAMFAVGPEDGCTTCVGDTWAAYGVDGDGDGRKNVYSLADAAFGAANYLHANGAPAQWKRAAWIYNHSESYYLEVEGWKQRYTSSGANTLAIPGGMSGAAIVRSGRATFANDCAREEFATQQFDPRLIAVVGAIVQQHTIRITAVACDHSPGTNHEAHRAIDIGSVDNTLCVNYSPLDACGQLVTSLSRIQGQYRVTELIAIFDPDPASADNFARADHADHIHVGFDAFR